MEESQKVVRRVRIDRKVLDTCRSYHPGVSLDRLIAFALENEIRRKQKKRLKIPF